MREPSDYSAEFAELLRSFGLEVALIGALAARRYRAVERQTTDVDFLARALLDLPERLEAAGYEVRTVSEPGGVPYVAFIRGHGVRVDVLAAETPFQHAALDRARDGVITVEDVIVHKLLAWRARDRDDIASILAAGHRLDEAYISNWAAAWDVGGRWEEALRTPGSDQEEDQP